jgi:tripartite-type tricarboxylate transporter receptor subunit TctC
MLTTGIKMNHVPYKGTAPATQALAGGEIQILMDTPSSMMPHVRGGRIKALGMASEKRIASAPDIPTLIESGVNVTGGTWVGWLAPAGAPPAAVARLSNEIQTIFKRQDIRERLIQMGIDPVGSSSAEFDKFLRAEVAKWAKVIKEAGVKIDG